MSKALVTTNHDEIKAWVEERGGYPARVKRTARRGGDAGLLRIDYPGYSGQASLEKISWGEWFETFDASKLAFLYQDEVSGGKTSRFSKLVSADAPAAKTGGRGGSARGGRAEAGRNGARAEARTSAKTRSAATSTRTKKKTASPRRGADAKRSTTSAMPTRAKKRASSAKRTTKTAAKRPSSKRSTKGGRASGPPDVRRARA